MKYTFTMGAKQRVTIDRSLLNGKISVYIDGKAVGPSHRGARGAAGTFYPIERGTLEVRSSPFELVPRVWYNEDWVDLVAPLSTAHYVLIALPLVLTAVISFGQIVGLIVGVLATLINLVVMHMQRPPRTRVVFCAIVAILAPIAAVAATFGLGMLLGGAH